MRYAKWIGLALAATVLYAFTVQNSSRTTQLSLDLYFGAWKLQDEASISAVVWASFLAGAVTFGGWGWWRAAAASRRARRMEQELALTGKSKETWG